jgi:hypothetical protein
VFAADGHSFFFLKKCCFYKCSWDLGEKRGKFDSAGLRSVGHARSHKSHFEK